MLRPRLESAFCTLFAILGLVTLVWPTWIEGLTGLEPDGGTGTAEWLVVGLFGAVAVVLGLLARRDYARVRSRALTLVETPATTSTGSML